jgi:alkylation response protein AidB-like acyl-CoA dehydrogenase
MSDENRTQEDLEDFRLRARAWLADNMPPRPAEDRVHRGWQRDRELQRKLYDGGFAGVCFPAEYGGLGLPHEYQQVLDEETLAYEMPLALNVPTFGIIAPTILEFGSEEQKRRYIPKILSGEEIWVQFLSEPTSGSDLASVTTRATLDGDAYVLNGSKIWSSGAHAADYAICVARTNWSVPKHDGITVLIVKIHQPGITVDQIIDTSGGDEFCQEFFDDVRIPVENVIGEPGAGWTVVRGLLAHERNCVGGASILVSGRQKRQDPGIHSDLFELAVETGQCSDPEIRQHVAEDYALGFVQRETSKRIVGAMTTGRMPPTAGALLRLMSARAAVRRSDLALEIAGLNAAVWQGDGLAGLMGTRYVGRQANEMGGGTTEMQRNIISERLLQMPREVAADRGIPFDEVRHNTAPRRSK